MNSVLIKNGRTIDPAGSPAVPADLFIEDDRIAALGQVPSTADITIDAQGLLITPGLIDIHVHFRQPGREQAETILSGSRAAVCGGFTAVAAMPNTTPCIDTAEMVRFVADHAQQTDLCRLYVVGAVTIGRQGRQLADLPAMAQAGALAFSDDGDYLSDRQLMQQAIDQAAALNLAIIQHCEDPANGRGDLNAGPVADATGLSGSSGQTEAEAFVRDVELLAAADASCRYHLAHVSSADTVRVLSLLESEGLSITTEATPHHLSLTDELCRGLDPLYKVRPPLRSAADVAALKTALADGTIDCLACDHAPHTPADKARDFAAAPAGMIGLETALAVYITELIVPGLLTWPQLIQKLTTNPAAVLGLERPRIAPGCPADLTLIDPRRTWLVRPEAFHSLSRNCPFIGRTLTGKAVATIVAGRIRYLDSLATTGQLPKDVIRY